MVVHLHDFTIVGYVRTCRHCGTHQRYEWKNDGKMWCWRTLQGEPVDQ